MLTRKQRLLKRYLLILTLALPVAGFMVSEKPSEARSQTAPPLSRTNAPAFGSVPAETACTACHTTNPLNDANGGGKIEILDLPTNYVPGKEYTLRVVATRPSTVKFGFELTALDPTGNKAGDFANLDTNRTAINTATFNGTSRQYIYHALASVGGTAASSTDKSEWTFKWTAPATRVGKIGFYAAGNCTNNSGSNVGDYVYTASAIVRPVIESVNGANYDKTAPITGTAGGILSGFGEDLASTTATASGDADPNTPGIQLPTTLSNVTVKVKDSLNVERSAGIFYVSPTQVNYLVPDGTANGLAQITITNGTDANAIVSIGTITIADIKPGIFTASMTGSGYAAAQIQRVRNGQVLGYEEVTTGTSANPVAVPIEWKDANDLLYLILYTTGVRQRSQLPNVTTLVGGGTQMVVYAGVQGSYAGLDQVNVLLNRDLATRGDVDVVLSVDGKAANTVKINFK